MSMTRDAVTTRKAGDAGGRSAMVPILSLWAPILVAAVIGFVASSILHMVLPYHRSDFRRVESEEALMESLRKLGVAPGNYMMPYAASPSAMKDPAFIEKRKRGPVAVLTAMRDASMGVSQAQRVVVVGEGGD